nr:nucleoside recognition domain-containing protein [uncultured Ruminococcus sp.]
MLNVIWSLLVIASVVCSFLFGKSENLSAAMVDSGADAVELLLTLAGILTLWSGIMKIAEKSGLTTLLARLSAPLLRLLFPALDKDGEAFGFITMNLTANLLGLGNTATPLGLRAMAELDRLNGHGDTASDEMVIFVVMNTASLQLLPTMLGSLRQSSGSTAPFEILVPVWLSSASALTVALSIAIILNKKNNRTPR